VNSATDDLLELFDYASERLRDRMQGLTDAEWAWRPSALDPKISIRWRLDHLASCLSEPRNWSWLGLVPPAPGAASAAGSAAAALSALADSSAAFRSVVADPAVDLTVALGAAAGPYAAATRRSFVLHIADELVHHAAEAALLRDLYAARVVGDR